MAALKGLSLAFSCFRQALLDHLPPLAPNFHILENLPHPILMCVPKKAGSMTFMWSFIANINNEDGTSWVLGPQNTTRWHGMYFKRRRFVDLFFMGDGVIRHLSDPSGWIPFSDIPLPLHDFFLARNIKNNSCQPSYDEF